MPLLLPWCEAKGGAAWEDLGRGEGNGFNLGQTWGGNGGFLK